MYHPTPSRASRAKSFAENFYDTGDAPDLRSPALESTSEFRVVEKNKRGQRGGKKKNKNKNSKGVTGDLATSDIDPGSSRAPSPTTATSPLKAVVENTIKETIKQIDDDEEIIVLVDPPLLEDTAKAKAAGNISSSVVLDPDLTLTLTQCDQTTPFPSSSFNPSFGSFTDIHLAAAEFLDTHSTRKRTREAMAQLTSALQGGGSILNGQDIFDSEEWDPDLPSMDDINSPEPAQVKPQPVTYTTVGSLVDPNAKPYFPAPNRIQREGASRQPLLSMMNSQQRLSYNSYLHGPNGAPAPLAMANSMAYAQSFQHSKSPGHAAPTQNMTILDPSEPSNRMAASQQMSPLSGKEAQVSKSIQFPRMMPSNTNAPPDATNPLSNGSKLSAFAPAFENKETLEGKIRGVNGNTKGSMLGSSSIGVLPAGLSGTIMTVAKAKKVAAEMARNADVVMGLSTFKNGLSELVATTGQGNLDRDFQFPAGFQPPQTAKINPLFGAQPSFTKQSNTARGPLPSNRGYPQPLTAGPPGQRQVARTFPLPTTNNLESIWGPNTPSHTNTDNAHIDQSSAVRSEISPVWDNALQPPHGNVYTSGVAQHPASIPIAGPPPVPSYDHLSSTAPLCDSLPPEAVLKYYPYGIPQDMNGSYRLLSTEKQKILDEAHLNKNQKAAQKAKDLDDNFYYGQRRYATMDGADYVQELEERERSRSAFGPIAPPKKFFPPGPAIKKIISKDEMEKMTVAEAALPCVEAAFGTLLAYADTAPSSRRHLSKFTEPANWQIDNSEEGNKSMFGEDWGRPPKRFGRDSRRQGNF